jgi:hypothetical protein
MITIDTGDHVFVRPLRETWLVAFCEGGRVHCCGWPHSIVPAAACLLVEKATKAEQRALLRELGNMVSMDARAERARRILRREKVPA